MAQNATSALKADMGMTGDEEFEYECARLDTKLGHHDPDQS